MKGILKFSLPEEREEFIIAQNGNKFYATISDIENYFRTNLKHNPNNYNEQELNFLEKIKEDVYDIIKDREIDIL